MFDLILSIIGGIAAVLLVGFLLLMSVFGAICFLFVMDDYTVQSKNNDNIDDQCV